jgi:hypothetical protein
LGLTSLEAAGRHGFIETKIWNASSNCLEDVVVFVIKDCGYIRKSLYPTD